MPHRYAVQALLESGRTHRMTTDDFALATSEHALYTRLPNVVAAYLTDMRPNSGKTLVPKVILMWTPDGARNYDAHDNAGRGILN